MSCCSGSIYVTHARGGCACLVLAGAELYPLRAGWDEAMPEPWSSAGSRLLLGKDLPFLSPHHQGAKLLKKRVNDP